MAIKPGTKVTIDKTGETGTVTRYDKRHAIYAVKVDGSEHWYLRNHLTVLFDDPFAGIVDVKYSQERLR